MASGSIDIFTRVIQRSSPDESWGLRLRGGIDNQEPVVVHTVRRRSVADKADVQVGDLVIAINNVSANGLTHDQVLELLANQHTELELTLSRSLSTSIQEHSRETEGSTSPGILAFLPITGAQPLASETVPNAPLPLPAPGFEPSPAPRYLGPRMLREEPSKSYQPLDMTGKNCFYPPPVQVFQPHRVPRSSAAYRDRTSVDLPEYGSTYTNQSSSILSPTSPPSDDPSWIKDRTLYYTDDDRGLSMTRPKAQSRSFLILEAALHEQGAGVLALPPPAFASSGK